jgi:hypothetical protein
MKKERITMLAVLGLLIITLSTPSLYAQWYDHRGWPGQESPSRFRWEGVVDGTVIVRVRRRQIDVETLSGLPVQRQRHDFTDSLPRARVDVDLNLIEGRGRVRLVQEPRPNNDYVAAVRIEDEDRGAGRYAFELRWRESDRRRDDDERGWGRERSRDAEWFEWEGRVDGESIIRIRGSQVWVDDLSGNGVRNAHYRFSSSLPPRSVQVSLVDADGRGEIVLVEQPSPHNGYTASVRIRDRQGGDGNYAFILSWQRGGGRGPDGGGWTGGSRVGLRWSGRVDGRDVIRIRGNQLWIDHEGGWQITDASYRFEQSLPYEPRTVTVKKREGRGDVRLIEQPSRYNDFTASILIEDKKGGTDRYEIEVSW